MSTKKMAIVGLFAAIAFAVMFLEFPIFPAANFLKYDPSEIFALLASLPYGFGAGTAVIIVKDILFYFAKSGDIVGIAMNAAAGIMFIGFALLFWKRGKIIAGIASVLLTTAGLSAINAVVVPLYLHLPFKTYMSFLPWIVAFNLVKFSINYILGVLLYRYTEKVFRLG